MMAPAAQAARGVRLGADTLSRLLDDLCKPGALERRRDGGERQLLEYVEAEARDLSADAFGKFMQEVYARLQAMIKRRARGAAFCSGPGGRGVLGSPGRRGVCGPRLGRPGREAEGGERGKGRGRASGGSASGGLGLAFAGGGGPRRASSVRRGRAPRAGLRRPRRAGSGCRVAAAVALRGASRHSRHAARFRLAAPSAPSAARPPQLRRLPPHRRRAGHRRAHRDEGHRGRRGGRRRIVWV
jgi:hypothetical protein